MLASFIFVDSCLCLQHCALRNGYNPITANSRDSTSGGNKTKPSTSFVCPLRRECDHHSLPTGCVGTPGTTYCRFLLVIYLFGFPRFLLLLPGRAGVCTSTRRPSVCRNGEGHRSQSQEGSVITLSDRSGSAPNYCCENFWIYSYDLLIYLNIIRQINMTEDLVKQLVSNTATGITW